MNTNVNIVVALTHLAQLDELQKHVAYIDLIEARADLIKNLKSLKEKTRLPLAYVLRSKKYGGCFNGTLKERHKLLIDASKSFDFVELEAEHDLNRELLRHIPKRKRRIAWYGGPLHYEMLFAKFEKVVQTPAQTYKFVIQDDSIQGVLPLIRLLNNYKSNDLVAYGVGASNVWTQILSPFLGAPEVHASLDSTEKLAPYFTPKRLVDDYGLPQTYDITQLFGIVGNPVLESISPKLHNASYRSLQLPYLYLPLEIQDFLSFKKEIMDNPNKFPIPINGLTVVAPFKQAAYNYSKYKEITHNKYAMACNGVVRSGNYWRGFSTDAYGAIQALEQLSPHWPHKQIAIIGCGGAGRSIAVSLKRNNPNITMVNRTEATGLDIATALELPFLSFYEFDPSQFDIIIHATPLGKQKGETPFNIINLNRQATVIDHVYVLDRDTELIQYCISHNIKSMDGKEIARLQIGQQFKHMTGLDMPVHENKVQNVKIN